MLAVAGAQTHDPKPAFAGQTDAPPPPKPSAPVEVQTIAGGLTGAWAFAFLPDGNLLVTQNGGTMRIVRPEGVVSAPLEGLPPMKSVAAQGLHDVVLDPDFARNRLLYFTYFAPPKGEAPGTWPIEFFYERVWTKPFIERRTMDLGTERVARARLSQDNSEAGGRGRAGRRRRAQHRAGPRWHAVRAGRRPVPVLRLGSRRRRARLQRQPRHPPQLHRPRHPHQPRRLDPEGQPVAQPRHRPARDLRARVQGSRRRGDQSADARAVGPRSRAAGRRRDQHRPRRQGLRLARRLLRHAVRRAAGGRPEERARLAPARPA